MSDIAAKLASLKTLKSEMKDWKKDDLRRKKGISDPVEPSQDETTENQSMQDEQAQKQSLVEQVLKKLMAK